MVYDQSLLVGLCTQDYKSLCAAVTIWHTLVDITDTGYTFLSACVNSSIS